MQIELAPEVEAKLAEEAGSRGLTATELSKQVLTNHVSYGMHLRKLKTPEQEKFFDDYIGRMKEKSPGWETRDPYDVDWQAIKAEGRKY